MEPPKPDTVPLSFLTEARPIFADFCRIDLSDIFSLVSFALSGFKTLGVGFIRAIDS